MTHMSIIKVFIVFLHCATSRCTEKLRRVMNYVLVITYYFSQSVYRICEVLYFFPIFKINWKYEWKC